MRAHILEGNVVVNTVEVDSLDALPNLVEATEGGIGWRVEEGQWIAPEIDTAEIALSIRHQRDEKLARSDWTQIASHLSTEQKSAWEVYRQALRDVPQQEGFPLEFQWPTEP